MTDKELGRALLSIGYRDYIGSRVLLNNGNILQGAMLASTSVEKYLKAILALYGIRCNFHMDNVRRIQPLFLKTPYKMLFDILDPVFIDLLSKAYRYRYLDDKTIKKPDTIGFLVNQFLGSLDFTILKLDSCFKIYIVRDGIEIELDTQLKRAAKSGLKDLWLNNYILNKIEKTEFMNRPSPAFGLYVDPLNFGEELEVAGTDVTPVYNGRICYLRVNKPSSQ